MSTYPHRLRFSLLALVLGLALLLSGGLAPTASATLVPAAPTVAQQAADAQLETARGQQAIQEAFDMLLDRYAIELDPTKLATAAQDGMTAALEEAGVASPAAGLSNPFGDRTQQWTALRQRYQALAARYADTLPPSQLAYAAIGGMAASTDDAHTNFLTPDEYQEHVAWTRGDVQYAGIGARMRGPLPTVVEVFPGTPAEQAGLRPGDAIVAVDGRSTANQRLDETVTQVRGVAGTPVVLSVQRAVTGNVDDLTLVRAQVAIPFVAARTLPDNFGYVALRGFPEPSIVDGIEKAIQQHQRDGVRGIVLDLRGNSGGRLDVGSRLLSRFIPNGPIYRAVDRRGREETVNVRDANPILTVPLAVLIDDGTASMGELFAAAIQEHHVGQVLGTTSAGAVSASVVMPLSDGSALQFTIEQVYSGGGALLDRVGVEPDATVELNLEDLRLGHDGQLEAALDTLREQAAQRPGPATAATR
jgi:carboxyl-terminal processing protease